MHEKTHTKRTRYVVGGATNACTDSLPNNRIVATVGARSESDAHQHWTYGKPVEHLRLGIFLFGRLFETHRNYLRLGHIANLEARRTHAGSPDVEWRGNKTAQRLGLCGGHLFDQKEISNAH